MMVFQYSAVDDLYNVTTIDIFQDAENDVCYALCTVSIHGRFEHTLRIWPAILLKRTSTSLAFGAKNEEIGRCPAIGAALRFMG